MGERLVVDQQMCDMVKLMLGGGATQEKVSKLMGIGETTVRRIKLAGFDRNTFYMNNDRRRIMEKNRRADRKIAEAMDRLKEEQKEQKPFNRFITADEVHKYNEELNGQMQMELNCEESNKEEKQEQEQKGCDQSKLIRFQAGKFGELDTTMQQGLERIAQKLDALSDKMSQIIRCIRGE